MKTKLHQSVILQFQAVGHGYVFHNIMVHSINVLRTTNVSFHMHYFPLLHSNINFFKYMDLNILVHILH
jgi:hypothetical protein